MAGYKETQAKWARRRCMEQDQDGQEGRWVTKIEDIWCEIKADYFVRVQFGRKIRF